MISLFLLHVVNEHLFTMPEPMHRYQTRMPDVLLHDSPLYSLDTGSLTKSGARVVPSQPQQSPCVCPSYHFRVVAHEHQCWTFYMCIDIWIRVSILHISNTYLLYFKNCLCLFEDICNHKYMGHENSACYFTWNRWNMSVTLGFKKHDLISYHVSLAFAINL